MVSRKDTKSIVSYHFIDSLLVLNFLPVPSPYSSPIGGGRTGGREVCDLGSGAGLPGIPLKIMRDDINLYLIESIQKKAAFLDLAVKELNLVNVKILAERAESIKDIKCDIVLIRLLGKIKELVPIALKLLKPAGKIIFYKSRTAQDEISEAKKVLAKFQRNTKIIEKVIPGTGITRRLVILEKKNINK